MADESDECDEEIAENVLVFGAKSSGNGADTKPNILKCLSNRQVIFSLIPAHLDPDLFYPRFRFAFASTNTKISSIFHTSTPDFNRSIHN